jgi:uncharacterized protein YraI
MNHLDSLLSRPFNRRGFLKTAGAGTLALAFGGTALLSQATARSTDTRIVNTEGARLRSGPGTGYTILASLAKGTEVQYLAYGGSANGYEWHKVKVIATGKDGFIAASLLSMPGSTGSDPVMIGTATTTAYVNLRSGPSTGHQVLRVVPSGASIQVSSTVQGGFRYVIHNGLAGWMSDAYISFDPGPGNGPVPNYHTTTANLNLRAEPSTSAKILLVIPSGAKVTPHGLITNGFAKVTYNGTVGWASTAYLK